MKLSDLEYAEYFITKAQNQIDGPCYGWAIERNLNLALEFLRR